MASSDAATTAHDLPGIPDYQLLKQIGRGAYGEVWLGRSLTGAFRAIKIVRREQFEHEEAFEREFHGIRNYEKVSRSHPALLDVLHVGRLRKPEIYYYVMELGDAENFEASLDFAWRDYTPRTLSTVLRGRKPLPPREVVKIGARLAEALDALHRSELIHRDIKPSNIVFVGGRPKLADLGLVAADGQRTCVGTLGYLAPEGPGSPAADIYGLGKVLYEISTGRDRLEFPRMPENFESIPDKEVWRRLNAIICRSCATLPRQRPPSAAALGAELSELSGERPSTKGRRPLAIAITIIGLAIIGGGAFLILKPSPISAVVVAPPPATPTPAPLPKTGSVKVISDPPEVQVFRGDELLGVTPVVLTDVSAGPVELNLVKSGFRTITLKGRVEAGGQILLGGEMSVWRPPVAGEIWQNGLGMRFAPSKGDHLSADPVPGAAWEKVLRKKSEGANVIATFSDIGAFCEALTKRERKSGYLADIQRYRRAVPADFTAAKLPVPNGLAAEKRPGTFHVVAETIPHGTLNIASEPGAARVTLNGEFVGTTGLTIDEVPAGPVEIRVDKEGYEPVFLKGTVVAGEMLDLKARMTRSHSLVFGAQWENSLGMRFVPLGDNFMVATCETRVRDYAAFAAANPSVGATLTDFPQTPNDPVVLVSRDDATAFCQWLTALEHEKGFLPKTATYRLPMDAEWSRAAGLANEPGHSPAARDGQVKGVFSWGTQWPPPARAGNFADAALVAGKRGVRSISGYSDGYAQTAPVGSFGENALGLYDVAGNVWEWVADDYGGTGMFAGWAVVRGGCWANEQRELLWSSYRNLVKPTMREPIFGFRVVISDSNAPVSSTVEPSAQ